jgi:hypothetical protein
LKCSTLWPFYWPRSWKKHTMEFGKSSCKPWANVPAFSNILTSML